MAANTSPIFLLTPVIWKVSVVTANTARDGTGTIATIGTGGTNGTRIDELVIKATADPADSIVTLFIHDGSSYFIFDEFDLNDPAAGSTTVASYRESRVYKNLVIPSGYSLRAAITVALTAGSIMFFAFGGDY